MSVFIPTKLLDPQTQVLLKIEFMYNLNVKGLHLIGVVIHGVCWHGRVFRALLGF